MLSTLRVGDFWTVLTSKLCTVDMRHGTVWRVVLGGGAVVVLVYAANLLTSVVHMIRCRNRVNQLPGLPLKPFIGNLHQIPRPMDARFYRFLRKNVSSYPYAFHLQMTPHRALCVVCHPDTIKLLLKTAEPKDMAGGGGLKLLMGWLGDGLLLSTGQKWFRTRRLLTPAFHFDILRPYVDVYNECTDILLDKWSVHAERSESFNLYTDISLCTLNVILRCAFSWEEEVQQTGASHPYIEAVFKIAEITANRLFEPWKHMPWLYRWSSECTTLTQMCDYVHKVADDVIKARRQHLKTVALAGQAADKKRLDFLDILLSARDADGSGLTDLEIRNEVDTFLFEGHDTTASAICWRLYSLAANPDIQEKARQEVDDVLKHREHPVVTWEDLNSNKLPYLTRCIKEAMRMYSPVPASARQLTKPLTVEGVELLPGTSVLCSIYGLHHNPLVWGDDHMTYDPDRFLPERFNQMDSYAFCPFSAGPRNCIGQNFAFNEEKVVIARILQRYILHLDPSYPPAEPIPRLVTRPNVGVNVTLTDRSKTSSQSSEGERL